MTMQTLPMLMLLIPAAALVGETLKEPQAFVQGRVRPAVAAPRHILTNEGVALLVAAGYSDPFILELIYEKQTRFDTTPEALAALAEAGVSARLVRYMVANPQKDALPEPMPAAAPVVTAPVRARLTSNGEMVPEDGFVGGPVRGAGTAGNFAPVAYGGASDVPAVFGGGFAFRTPAAYLAPVSTAYYVTPRWWQSFRPYMVYSAPVLAPAAGAHWPVYPAAAGAAPGWSAARWPVLP